MSTSAKQPDERGIQSLCQRILRTKCIVTFFAAGSFNRLYLIKRVTEPEARLIIRIALPVDPEHKTKGEVATLNWVQQFTDIPVPKVFAYDESDENEIGAEWIMMYRMIGVAAKSLWDEMPLSDKKVLVRRVAEYQAQLLGASAAGPPFRGIGTLLHDQDPDESISTAMYEPDILVSKPFFTCEDLTIHRGPFRSSHDWLSAYLDIIIKSTTRSQVGNGHLACGRGASNEYEYSEAALRLQVAARLKGLLPKVFPSICHPSERSLLWHQDLSLNNILVSCDNNITGIVDWECVSAMPLWLATQFPRFLQGPDQYGAHIRRERGVAG